MVELAGFGAIDSSDPPALPGACPRSRGQRDPFQERDRLPLDPIPDPPRFRHLIYQGLQQAGESFRFVRGRKRKRRVGRSRCVVAHGRGFNL